MSRPPELARLLDARTPAEHELAWSRFTTTFTPILLHTARKVVASRDGAMDAYVYVLEHLRERDCARLRAYADDGPARFTTWLVVVARRLCVDWQRSRYGRAREAESSPTAPPARRRLEDLLFAEVDPATLPVPSDRSPDNQLLRRETDDALNAALGRLTARDRLLLTLRFEDEQSAARIARLLDFPTPFHVYRRVNSLLLQLKRDLQRRGIDSAG